MARRKNPLPIEVEENRLPQRDRYGQALVRFLVSLSGHFHALRHEPVDEEEIEDEIRKISVAIDDIQEEALLSIGFSPEFSTSAEEEYFSGIREWVNMMPLPKADLQFPERLVTSLLVNIVTALMYRMGGSTYGGRHGVEVSIFESPVQDDVVVNIATEGLEDNANGPSGLRVVLNDDYEDPLWEN